MTGRAFNLVVDLGGMLIFGGELNDFARRLTLPPSLAAIGFKRDQIERAAELMVANPILNPRPLRRSTIRALLDSALAGEPPPWPFEE